MKRIMTACAATAAFAISPAFAEQSAQSSVDMQVQVEEKDGDAFIEKSTTMVPSTDLDTGKAQQAFQAIDADGDGTVTEAEWADWQSDEDNSLDQFAEYDANNDGSIELAEYVENF